MASRWSPVLGSRSLFVDLQAAAYLNHAAISPASLPTLTAVREAADDYARAGVGAFPRWDEQRKQLRQDIATLIGASSEEIGLGWNTSRGVSDLALSIPWKKGDRVVLFRGEFPANVTPWQQAAQLFELELVFLDAEAFQTEEGLEQLALELQRGARLVAVSAVQFQTGLRMPLARMGQLCRAHGAELCVDAIQACGAVPIDVEAECIDYLATGGHKWLLGFEGAGFVYVRQACAERLRPYTAGWLSHEEPASFLFQGAGHLRYDRSLRRRADVFETGTANLLGLAALGASVELLLELCPEDILRHVSDYLDSLESQLVERGFESLRSVDTDRRACILCLRPPPGIDALRLNALLRSHHVVTAAPEGNLRFAPHYANNKDELPLVLAAVDAATKELRRV